MGFYRGPNIVRDGLVFAIDAGSERSYPGSGTVVTNLVGAGTGNLINGVVFSSNNGGTWDFDGVDDYINLSFNTLSSNAGTIDVWVQRNGTTGNSFVFAKVGVDTNRYYLRQVGTDNFDAARGNPLSSAGFGSLNLNEYYNLVMTWNTNTIYAYKNGILQNTTSYTNPGTDITDGTIGSGPGAWITMGLTKFNIYNRTLTSSEILQNYNAQKSRFGL